MWTILLIVFLFSPVLLIGVGYLVARAALWAGALLILVGAFAGFAGTLFWYALIFGSVLGMIFPKVRTPGWS